jgi:hypothetical protein
MRVMLHKRLVQPVLERLDREKAVYFGALADGLAEDRRAQADGNLVFLVLKEAVALLPTALPRQDLVDLLIAFVHSNREELNRVIFSRDFIRDPGVLRPLANRFVGLVVDTLLERVRKGEVETGEGKVRRFAWPYTDTDFPFDE